MSPKIDYDYDNDIAYITYSNNHIVKSIVSHDELLVFDVDKNKELVGIEILSVKRLMIEAGFNQSSGGQKKMIDPNQIPTYLIPKMYDCYNQ